MKRLHRVVGTPRTKNIQWSDRVCSPFAHMPCKLAESESGSRIEIPQRRRFQIRREDAWPTKWSRRETLFLQLTRFIEFFWFF